MTANSTYRRRLAVGIVVAVLGLVLPSTALAGAGPAVVGAVANNTSLSGAIGVAVAGNYAYTTAYWPGQLTVVDISNPLNPHVVGTTAASTAVENASTVTVAGSDVFVVSKNRNGPCLPGPYPSCASGSNDDGSGNSLTIVDVSNPTSPTVVGTPLQSSTELFGAYGIAVHGNYAYVAYQGLLSGQPQGPDTSAGGFTVIDISNLLAPTIVKNIDNSSLTGAFTNGLDHATSVAISPNGNYAYVTAFNGWKLTAINISNPASASVSYVLSDGTHLQWANYVTVAGNYAYVANQAGSTVAQFTILSLLNQAQPVVVGSLTNSVMAGAYRVRVRGNFAYVAANSTSSVAAIDISNPASPRLAASLTDAAHLHSTSDLDLDPSGRYVIANSSGQSGSGNTPYPPFTPSTGTISVIDMIPNPIAVPISSAPPSATTSTSASFGFAANNDVSTVACSLDGAAYGACASQTAQTYSGLAVGSHTFRVQAADAAGNTATSTDTWTVGTVPQAGSPGPSISGKLSPGQTLTAAPGTWSGSPAPAYTYQWSRCDQSGQNCVNFGTASSNNTYTVQTSDLGSSFAVTVTATNSVGSAQATSAATGAVSGVPTNIGAPTVSGTTTQGKTLTAAPGSWSGYPNSFTYAYQWQRCDQNGQNCANIGTGATTYVLQRADVGQTVRVLVTATNTSGSSAPTPSAATARVSGPPVNTSLPKVSGTDVEGSTLTATPGTWTGYPAPGFSYEWQRCPTNGEGCTMISTARSAKYTLTAADVGHSMRIYVVAQNTAGSQPARSSGTPLVQSSSSGALKNASTATPTLILHSQAPGRTITKLMLGLGKGAKFASSVKALARGISIVDSSGHRVAFKAKLVHGSLVITLKHGVSKLTITLKNGALTFSAPLVHAARKHGSRLTLTVVLSETGNRSARDRIQLPLH